MVIRFIAHLLLLAVLIPAADALGKETVPTGANTMCPVMTDQPAKADRFVDYEGKRIYLCCDKCMRKFKADPTKYLGNIAGNPGTMATLPSPTMAGDPAALPSLLQFFGKLHVATVHFPIALLVLAALIEAYPFRKKTRGPADAAYLCLVLGCAAAVCAAGMGWVLAAETFGGEDGRTLGLHRWLGVTLAGGSVGLLILATVSRRRGATSLLYAYRTGVFTCALLVGIVGHLGGTLTHGEDYFALAPTVNAVGQSAEVVADLPASAPAEAALPEVAPVVDGMMQTLLFGTDAEIRAARIKTRLAYVPKPPAPPAVDGPVLNEIDRFIVGKWREAKLSEATTPPLLCDDATFLRRVYLDVVGVIPTAAETERFLSDGASDKRVKLVDELLGRSGEYAAHWTPFFEDGIASTPAELIGGIPTHGNYQGWIYESFKANKPYDVMVEELLDPTNLNYQRKPPVNVLGVSTQRGYVMNADHKSTLSTAANVGQFFLGTGMKCASCHSHFLNPEEWPQTKFMAFAGMFAPMDLELIRCEKSSGKFIPAGFPLKVPGAPATMPADVDQRLHLAAKLITDPANPRFARTMVNRLWKKYLGLGLFEPADDWREDSPPSNPELLDWLAYDFVEHGYDIKRTVRMILTSRTYQLRYDPKLEDHFDVAKREEPRYYRSPSLRRMTYEQLLDSVRMAAAQKLDDKARLYHKTESTSFTRSLGKPGNRSEISTARADDVAIVQSLELLNGREWHEMVYRNPLLNKLAKEAEPAKVVATLYASALSRPPTEAEGKVAVEFLSTAGKSVGGDPVEGDLLWALLTSPEFQYIR